MKRNIAGCIALLSIMMGVAGCSRTVEDVSKWESKGDAGKLISALADPKFEVRQAAAESLGTLKAESAADALAACLNDPEESVKLAAIDALAAIGTPDTITPLIAAFKLDNQEARLKAAKALGTLKAEASADILVEALDDPDEAIRLAACKALAHIGGTTALNALVDRVEDQDDRLRDEARNGLIRIGEPAVPAMIKGLRSANLEIRKTSIQLLRGLSSVPRKGSGLVWFQLACSSLDDDPTTKTAPLESLATEDDVIPTLIEAASLDVDDIREAAMQALDWIGEPALDDVNAAASRVASTEAQQWMTARSDWIGSPSPLLDLYAAVSALNPSFPPPRDPQAILLSSDAGPERADIPELIKLLSQDACREQAILQLKEAGPAALLPLIAAITSTNTPIAEAAAEILSDRADPRAYQPLMTAVQTRVDAGEALSRSPLYTALIKQNNLEAEPLILKVRPNTERAQLVFCRRYREAKVTGISTTDPLTDNEAPITFYIGYTENNQSGSMEVTFKKDKKGRWYPSPALPYQLKKSAPQQLQQPAEQKKQAHPIKKIKTEESPSKLFGR